MILNWHDKWQAVTHDPLVALANCGILPGSSKSAETMWLEQRAAVIHPPTDDLTLHVSYLSLPFSRTYNEYSIDPYALSKVVLKLVEAAAQPGCEWFPLTVHQHQNVSYLALKEKVEGTQIDNELYLRSVYTVIESLFQWLQLSPIEEVVEKFRIPTEDEITGTWTNPKWRYVLQKLIGFSQSMGDVNEIPKAA